MVKPQKRIDAHVHYALPLTAERLVAFMDKTETAMANLVLVPIIVQGGGSIKRNAVMENK